MRRGLSLNLEGTVKWNRIIAGALTPMGWLLLAVGPPMTHASEGFTLAALRLAYQREVCAGEQYEACAERAWMEEYLGARNLFLALVMAEDVHARRLAFILEQMDVTPETQRGNVPVRTTRENLRSAIEGEVFERVVAYDRFKEYARDELCYEALAVFRYACDAEATHAAKLAEALVKLDEMRRPHTYFVCPGCGCVRSESCSGRCDCGESGSRFVAVIDTTSAPPAAIAERVEAKIAQ